MNKEPFIAFAAPSGRARRRGEHVRTLASFRHGHDCESCDRSDCRQDHDEQQPCPPNSQARWSVIGEIRGQEAHALLGIGWGLAPEFLFDRFGHQCQISSSLFVCRVLLLSHEDSFPRPGFCPRQSPLVPWQRSGGFMNLAERGPLPTLSESARPRGLIALRV